jgi:hypothetical protein
MSTAEYQHDGTYVNSHSVLWQSEFYHKNGITAACHKYYEKWNAPLQEAQVQISQVHY